MKYLTTILRICVGALFIFSGLIKSNDPTGFSYKLDEYFSVFSADLEPHQDSLHIELGTDGNQFYHHDILNILRPQIQINTEQSSWQLNASTEEYQQRINVKLNNQTVIDQTITAADTTTNVVRPNLRVRIGNHEIYNHHIDFSQPTITLSTRPYIHKNGLGPQFFQWLRNYSLQLGIFICVLEVTLGLALILGWAPRLIVISIFILTLFFTFLTWYSAYFNKVTDCGCFGDAIKLTPWQSFNKDIVIGIATLIVFNGLRYIKPIFSAPFSVKILTITVLLSSAFSIYCWHFLPVKNFLKFKEGNNIYKLATVPDDAPSDVYENLFIYQKNGVNEEFTLAELSSRNLNEEGYVFVDRIDHLISKGYEPEIHDFKIMDNTRTNDYVDDFFQDSGYKAMLVFNDLEKTNTDCIDQLKLVIEDFKKRNIAIYPLTASKYEDVAQFTLQYGLDIPFYYGDKTNLKSIIRSNPGVVLLKGNTVWKNWPSTRLPDEEELNTIIAK